MNQHIINSLLSFTIIIILVCILAEYTFSKYISRIYFEIKSHQQISVGIYWYVSYVSCIFKLQTSEYSCYGLLTSIHKLLLFLIFVC